MNRNYDDILTAMEEGASKAEFKKIKKYRTLWNRLSELTKIAERYLVFKAVETMTPCRDLLLLRELKKRNLNSYFEHQIDLSRKSSNFSSSNPAAFQELYGLDLEYLKSISCSKKFETRFGEASDHRIAFFVLEILDQFIQISDLKSNKTFTSKIYVEEFIQSLNLEALTAFIRKNVPDLYPQILFLYSLYKSLQNPFNQIHYKTAKRVFEKDLKNLPEEIRLRFYGYLMDYNINRINEQKPKVNAELFRVINNKLKEGLCGDILTGNLKLNMFRDYLLVALMLKKYKWTENFINEFGSKLPKELRESSINLGKALLMFYKKEYKQSGEFLSKVSPVNDTQYIDHSLLKLKVFYELKEIEKCIEELRRIKEYLRKERPVLKELVKFTKDFCTSYNLLIRLNQHPTEKKLNNLQFELSKGKIFGRKWIKDKIKDIEVINI